MQRNLPVIAVNGVVDKQVSPLDRGFTYGDGVFETCNMVNAIIPLWAYHKERLVSSCAALLIPIQIDLVENYLQRVIEQVLPGELKAAVVKIIVTRGEGGRGYRLPDVCNATICIGVFPAPAYPDHYQTLGVSVRVCNQRLADNPSLAGLKHLNRLEQILARAEWHDDIVTEGLLLDVNGNLIEATASNIFIVKNAELITPDLSCAGVAGVMRRFILEVLAVKLGLTPIIKKVSIDELHNADEVFLSNSVFGIWPIINIIDEKSVAFVHGAITQALQQLLARHLAVT